MDLVPLLSGSDSVAEAQTCVVTATETIGPYPNHTAFNRQDIREGRPGLPLQVALTVVFLPESGTAVTKTFDLERTSRLTVYGG